MALRLTLKPHERIIVNGCILKNGPRRHVLEVENRADVLRGEEMLDAQSANTPGRRIAYQIQIALVSPAHRAELEPKIIADLDRLAAALARFAPQIAEAETAFSQGAYYSAFRALTPIFVHEDQLLSHASEPKP